MELVVLRTLQRVAERCDATRDDADLLDRVRVRAGGRADRVADLVIGRDPLVVLGHPPGLLLEPRHLALDGRFFQRDDLSGPLAIRLAEIERAIENKKAEAKRLVRKMAQFDDEDRDEFDDVLRAVKQEQRALEGECAKVAEELQAARGHLPPNVHLQRVLEVREAINDPSDPEAMRDARLKVREAIRNVVDVVWCDPVEMIGGVPTRTLTLLMAGNAAGIKFDNQGNTIGTFNFLPELAAGGASYTLRDGTTVSTNANALRDALLNRPVRLSASEEEADAAASEKRDAAARLDTVLKRGRSRRTA